MKKLITLLLFVLLFTACSENSTGNENNHPPEIISLVSNPDTIKTDATSILTCNATDSDDDELTFFWESDSGSIDGSSSSVNWLAPSVVGNYLVKCKVLDGNGGQDIDSVNIVVEQKIPIQGLITYWPFNGNANDESGNGNDGTAFGGVTYVSGKIDQAAKFDGLNDYIRNSNPPVLQVLGSVFSISFWLKPEGNQNSGVIDIGQETKETWEIAHSNQLIGFTQNWNRAQGTEAFPHHISTPLNIWSYVTLIYNNKHLDMYLNGTVAVGGNFNNNPIIDGDEWLEIGVNAAAADEYYKGQIDEIRIYNRALNTNEIMALYNQGN